MQNSNQDARDEEEKIEISLDDLEEPTRTDGTVHTVSAAGDQTLVVELEDDSGSAHSRSATGDSIEISLDDLDNQADAFPTVYPGVSAGMATASTGKKKSPTALTGMSGRSILRTALAGLIGGGLAWLVSEPIQSASTQLDDLGALVADAALFAGLAGASIGTAIAAANWLSFGAKGRGSMAVALSALFGTLGGVFGGCIAQDIYGVLSLQYLIEGVGQILLRAVGWSIMGLFFGLGQAASTSTRASMRNGIVGGAAGGLLGGVAFQLILSGASNDSVGRLLALCVVGTAIGLMLSLVEEVSKEAWICIVKGLLTGKQFILYQDRTAIGSSPSCDIVLSKDPSVAPEHAVVANQGTGFLLTSHASTEVNGTTVTRHVLQDGDLIGIGNSRIEFHERLAAQKPIGGRRF